MQVRARVLSAKRRREARIGVICGNCGVGEPAGPEVLPALRNARSPPGCPNCGSTNEPRGGILRRVRDAAGRRRRDLDRRRAPTGERAGGRRPRAASERRLVTVLFADLVGFTTVAEGLDAEDTRDLLGRYFEVAREIVERYGGTVEKFIGDAVMAVWGAPTAHEDDAERAVRAALDLVAAVPSWPAAGCRRARAC